MKALSFSAKAAGDEEEEMSNSEIAITMVFSTLFAIALFVALPTFVVKFIPGIQDNHFILNLVEVLFDWLCFCSIYGVLVKLRIYNVYSNTMEQSIKPFMLMKMIYL